MHELSITSAIVDRVLEFADETPAKVLEVRLAIGELTCIHEEQMRFCYEALIRETPIAHSTLSVDRVAASVKCSSCSYEGTPKYWDDESGASRFATLQCPRCGLTADAVHGFECQIKNIRYTAHA